MVRVPYLKEAEEQSSGQRGRLRSPVGTSVVFGNSPDAEVIMFHGRCGRHPLKLSHLEATEGENRLKQCWMIQ